jgi:hypothetical protein
MGTADPAKSKAAVRSNENGNLAICAMTLEQLKLEFRLAYDGRDRERLERALKLLEQMLKEQKPK